MDRVVSSYLREAVLEANLVIPRERLAALTWGNVSGVDRDNGLYLIKPSGVPYDQLAAEMMVPVDLATGAVLSGDLKPSSDSETHRLLYNSFDEIGGVTHTHSTYAVAWAQAGRAIPMLGTTHADTFNGDIPVTRELTEDESFHDYELNTGRAIVERVHASGVPVMSVPAVLTLGHGPFTWGTSAKKSVEHAVVCEAVAEMALHTLAINPQPSPPSFTMQRHFARKHGPGAYYGQVSPPG